MKPITELLDVIYNHEVDNFVLIVGDDYSYQGDLRKLYYKMERIQKEIATYLGVPT